MTCWELRCQSRATHIGSTHEVAPIGLCGTHANAKRRRGWKVVPINGQPGYQVPKGQKPALTEEPRR